MAASHCNGRVVEVFKTKNRYLPHCNGVKYSVLGRIKGYLMIQLISKRYDNRIIVPLPRS